MSSRPTVASVLRALAAAMSEAGVRWYLFGAQAAIIWGSPRLSADVDITVMIDAARRLDDFVETMKRHGFDAAPVDADFIARTRVLPS